MTPPEFSRPIALDTLGEAPRAVAIDADSGEQAALAERFGLIEIASLHAEARLRREGDTVFAEGRVMAAVTQTCIASGAPVAASVDEAFSLQFRPMPSGTSDEEIELGESELDVTFYEGGAIDLGEAAAETLALALDPYPRAPEAEAALDAAGVKSEEEADPPSPFAAALAALKGKLKP